jgi:cytochrome P450
VPRKPNYQFERMERDRAKASKLAEKVAARRRKRDAEEAGDERPLLASAKEDPI